VTDASAPTASEVAGLRRAANSAGSKLTVALCTHEVDNNLRRRLRTQRVGSIGCWLSGVDGLAVCSTLRRAERENQPPDYHLSPFARRAAT
jgi:formylglycine-generating enzyme required for sulfatase activity